MNDEREWRENLKPGDVAMVVIRGFSHETCLKVEISRVTKTQVVVDDASGRLSRTHATKFYKDRGDLVGSRAYDGHISSTSYHLAEIDAERLHESSVKEINRGLNIWLDCVEWNDVPLEAKKQIRDIVKAAMPDSE